MRFKPEPSFTHGQAPRIGVVWANLGTPDAPTPAALRRYLGEFLSDPRVVEIPALVWKVILHGIILRVRPAKSAAKYASVWTPDGSPLAVWTQRQAKLLQGYLGERGHSVTVLPAMRYGQPSIASALDALRAQGADKILILPAYPQYSGATTASTFDAVSHWVQKTRRVPALRLVAEYHDHPAYIEALAASVRAHWKVEGPSRMLVMSFHGMPERTLHLGDPYHCQCHKTARLMAEALELSKDQYRVTFQSRFGKAKWLEPSTEPTLKALPAQGHERVDVICPGFVADCLETLEEIQMEGKEAFLHAGGKQFHYIPCLNADHAGISALVQIATEQLAGWPTTATLSEADGKASAARAREMGASR